MHGTEHGLDETLDDHHNGRCVMLPMVAGLPNPVEQSGEDWFGEQSETKQRELMGKEKYESWQGGAFNFGELAGSHVDDVYGRMTAEAPLWQLLGTEP
jgi:hypothetical protein